MLGVNDIREEFRRLREAGQIAENNTLEILNASFVVDEPTIFGKVNRAYVEKELHWYLDMNLNISGLEPDIPAIWQQVADKCGNINSNYGWCIFSIANGLQFEHAVDELIDDPTSRRAVMLYNRPSMHVDAFANGMRDFICTYSTQMVIRDSKLHYMVFMRSNDAIFGFKNDAAWHKFVHQFAYGALAEEYAGLELGDLYWNAGSLHIYERHFHLVK